MTPTSELEIMLAEILPIWEEANVMINELRERDAELEQHNAHALAQADRIASRDQRIHELELEAIARDRTLSHVSAKVVELESKLLESFDDRPWDDPGDA